MISGADSSVNLDPADALAEQLALLELEGKLSHTNIDQIRQQVRESAVKPFQWGNIDVFRKKLNAILDTLASSESRVAQTLAIAERFSASTSASSSTSNASFAAHQSERANKIDIEKIRKTANAYFDLLASPDTDIDKKLYAAKLNVVKEYNQFYLKAFDLMEETSRSLAWLVMFYLAVKGDLLLSRKTALNDELQSDMMAASLSVFSFRKKPDGLASVTLRNIFERLYMQIHYQNPNYLLPKECEYYINLKNLRSRKMHAPTHIELLDPRGNFAPDARVNLLFEKAMNIKNGLQPRTQFVFFISQNHGLLVDIDWDKYSNCFKIIMLEPTNVSNFVTVLKMLNEKLSKDGFASQYLACAANLQKDNISCVFYSLIMASYVSYLSFDELNKHPGFGSSCGNFPGLKLLPVTAFGEKLILMGQSSNEMRENLRKLYNNNEEKVTRTMNQWKDWYAFPGSTASAGVGYIRYRQESLYGKAMGTRRLYTTQQIFEATHTNNSGLALRKLAAGAGPGYMLTQLLTQVSSSVINEAGASSGKTALHFAYQFNQLGRANRLIAQGANQELKDRNGLTPRECLKRTP